MQRVRDDAVRIRVLRLLLAHGAPLAGARVRTLRFEGDRRFACAVGRFIVVGLETVRGVADCRRLLRADVDAAYFGAEDYIADIGGRRTAKGDEVLYARSEVRLATFLAEVSAVDQAVVAIRDDDRFRTDAEQGRAIGYTGKICVHPRQVELAHEVFTPTAAEVRHARAVLGAADQGVAVVDGQMVDDVHVRMARAVLARLPKED